MFLLIHIFNISIVINNYYEISIYFNYINKT